jgi:hypothetical protein
MQISHTHKLAESRGHYSISRIRAAAEWRASNAPGGQSDRLAAVQELIREVQEYGAAAIKGVGISRRRRQARRHWGNRVAASCGHGERCQVLGLRVQKLLEKEITYFGNNPTAVFRSGHLPTSFRWGKAINLRSVIATVGASGAVTFQLIANIPPARAAGQIDAEGEGSPRRDHRRGKTHRRCEGCAR